jgi:hypothetical protein
VQLTWTAPGDDAAAGTLAGLFEVRLSSTAAMDTDIAWDQAGSEYPYRLVMATTAVAGSAHRVVITGLCTGTTYYCAIKSADERGNYSVLAAAQAYPVNSTPLGFGFIGPLDNTISTTGQPELSWTAAPDPDEPYGDRVAYEVVYATDSAFSTPFSISTPVISCTCDFLPYEDKTIYWRVYARDTDGATVAIVPGQYRIRINAVNTAPATFALTAPADGSITATTTLPLSWAAASDADPGDTVRYTVTWSRFADFSVAAASAGITGTAYTVPALVENATYWWAVRADDGKESSSCAATFYVMVDAVQEPPAAFALAAPSDSQVLSSTTVQFSWQAANDPDPTDTLTYRVSWAATADFASSTTVAGLPVAAHTSSGFAENGIYYWRATATDNDGLSTAASQTYRFYIDTVKELPGSFDLQNPANGCIISTTTTPLFSWTRSMDADPADDIRYIIDLSPNPNFTGLGTMAIDRGADRYYLPLIGLTDQTTYYWRVRASGYQGNPLPQQVDDGFTFSSTTGTFVIAMTNNAPENFALQSPTNGATLSSKRVSFAWSAATDLDVNASVSYAVWIATVADFSVTLESATVITGLAYDASTVFPENRTYYWKVRAVDNQGLYTECSSTFTFHLPVLNTLEPPAGLTGTLAADKNTYTISWSPVTRNTDASTADDLAVYRVYRGLSAQRLTVYASVAAPASHWSDTAVDGGNYYYRITAVDASEVESALEHSPVINSLGAGLQTLITADQSVAVEIPPAVAASLCAANNAYQQTLRLQLMHDAAAENDGVLLSYRLQVIAENGAALENMVFAEPLTLRFYYAAAAAAARRTSTAAAESRHVFWHNGIEYIRVGGTDDPAEQCVVLCAAKTGEYQLRVVVRPAVFALAGTNPRKVFTPGIAPYEKISFYVDNPENDKVTGAVFNLRGELICNLTAVGDATAANVILEWDGKESDGAAAPKGVYIYQIKGSGKVVNGTVLVAR